FTGFGAGILWFISEQNLRYSLFAGLLMTIGCSVCLERCLANRALAWRAVAGGYSLLLFFAGLYAQLERPTSWLFQIKDAAAMPLSRALGRTSAEEHLTTHLRHVPLLRHVDQYSGANALVWEIPWLRDHLHLAGHAIALP